MSKICPECGKTLPETAKFCMDCGHDFSVETPSKKTDLFSTGKLFLIIIIAILVIGGVFILTSGGGDNNSKAPVDDVDHVDMTVTDVLGSQNSYDGKTSYFIYTEALFLDVPDDMKGYIIKTSYCDKNGTVLGQETEKLSNVYYDTDYSISFGYYTSYSKLDLDHVKVEIIKNGKTVDEFTHNVDKNKLSFLN